MKVHSCKRVIERVTRELTLCLLYIFLVILQCLQWIPRHCFTCMSSCPTACVVCKLVERKYFWLDTLIWLPCFFWQLWKVMLAVVLPVLVLVFCFPSVVARLSEGNAFSSNLQYHIRIWTCLTHFTQLSKEMLMCLCNICVHFWLLIMSWCGMVTVHLSSLLIDTATFFFKCL